MTHKATVQTAADAVASENSLTKAWSADGDNVWAIYVAAADAAEVQATLADQEAAHAAAIAAAEEADEPANFPVGEFQPTLDTYKACHLKMSKEQMINALIAGEVLESAATLRFTNDVARYVARKTFEEA